MAPSPTVPPPPGLASLPTHQLHSASATAHRDHQRRLKRAYSQPAGTPPMTASLSTRLRRKLKEMAQFPFRPPTNVMTTTAYGGAHPDLVRLSQDSLREFGEDITLTVLHFVAKGLHMDPAHLVRSPALRQLLQPYVQWMGNAPHWMQFAGLLFAKKCHGLVVQPPPVQMEAEMIAAQSTRPIQPTDPEGTDPNQDCWMSIVPAPEYIDVDALHPTPEADSPHEEAYEDPQAAAYLVEPTTVVSAAPTSTPVRKPRSERHGSRKKKTATEAEVPKGDKTVEEEEEVAAGHAAADVTRTKTTKKRSKNETKPHDADVSPAEKDAKRRRKARKTVTPLNLPDLTQPVSLVEDTITRDCIAV